MAATTADGNKVDEVVVAENTRMITLVSSDGERFEVTHEAAKVKFIRSLVCRFGVPNRIITDNGSQFISGAFKAYCGSLGTQICYASVAHPRSNGQAERANAEVLKGLKTRSFNRLKASGKHWIDELPSVLWSIRTTPTKPTARTRYPILPMNRL